MVFSNYQDFVKGLPTQPGVYQMINAQGQVIYVGKARYLKNRVSQYFHKQLSHKTQTMMQQVTRIETTITSHENEALLLEAELIKKLKPRYNILLRDDKSYPYLYFSSKHPFPRLDFYRGNKEKVGRYFGPYPSAKAVRDSLLLIQKLFKLRQCNDVFFTNRTRPCLQYQIKRCTAPCVGYVDEQAYRQQVDDALLFLEGKNEEIMSRLTVRMEQAAQHLAYEQAAEYRNQITQLRQLQQNQVLLDNNGNSDVIGISQQHGQLGLSFLYIRGGRLIGSKAFFSRFPSDKTAAEALSEFIPQYYLSPLHRDDIPEMIIAPIPLEDRAWIENALSEMAQRPLRLVDQGKLYKSWQHMACVNAEQALSQHLSQKQLFITRLVALQNALGLPNIISRIECFDVSHTLGEETMASCVVLNEHGFVKKEYRHFSVSDVTPGDDYAALNQVIKRRYLRVKEAENNFPDLIIVDGGLGQLKQAVSVLEELQISGVALMGVAKGPTRKPGLEKIFLWGKSGSLSLASDDPALHFIQQIRDEAHRFAITAHRARRDKKRLSSPLEQIKGVGPKRRKQLLNYFGGLQPLSQASIEEISRVPGISHALAIEIYKALHE